MRCRSIFGAFLRRDPLPQTTGGLRMITPATMSLSSSSLSDSITVMIASNSSSSFQSIISIVFLQKIPKLWQHAASRKNPLPRSVTGKSHKHVTEKRSPSDRRVHSNGSIRTKWEALLSRAGATIGQNWANLAPLLICSSPSGSEISHQDQPVIGIFGNFGQFG